MYNITNILFDFPVDSMEHIVKKQMEENNKKTCNIRNKNLKNVKILANPRGCINIYIHRISYY